MAEKRLFRWGDAVPAVCCVTLAVVLAAVQLTSAAGDRVHVQTPNGETVLSLAEDAKQVFVGYDDLSVTVTVQGGTVSVTRADCPDQVCVHTGAIAQNGQTIACLPAGIVLTVQSRQADVPDAVAR